MSNSNILMFGKYLVIYIAGTRRKIATWPEIIRYQNILISQYIFLEYKLKKNATLLIKHLGYFIWFLHLKNDLFFTFKKNTYFLYNKLDKIMTGLFIGIMRSKIITSR